MTVFIECFSESNVLATDKSYLFFGTSEANILSALT